MTCISLGRSVPKRSSFRLVGVLSENTGPKGLASSGIEIARGRLILRGAPGASGIIFVIGEPVAVLNGFGRFDLRKGLRARDFPLSLRGMSIVPARSSALICIDRPFARDRFSRIARLIISSDDGVPGYSWTTTVASFGIANICCDRFDGVPLCTAALVEVVLEDTDVMDRIDAEDCERDMDIDKSERRRPRFGRAARAVGRC